MPIQARLPNHCCRGKAVSNTYSECVSVALVIQHVVRVRHVTLSSVASLAVPYFSTLSDKRYDSGGGGGGRELLNIKSVC